MRANAKVWFREIAAFVGVVGGLLFVGLQLQQSTKVARAEAYRGFADILSEWYYVSVADEDLALALRRISFEGARRADLTDAQKWKVGAMMLVLVRSMETVYYQVEDGVLPPHALNLHNQTAFTQPYMQDVWPLIKPELNSQFAAYFEERFFKATAGGE